MLLRRFQLPQRKDLERSLQPVRRLHELRPDQLSGRGRVAVGRGRHADQPPAHELTGPVAITDQVEWPSAKTSSLKMPAGAMPRKSLQTVPGRGTRIHLLRCRTSFTATLEAYLNRRHFLAASALPFVTVAAPRILRPVRAEPMPFDRGVIRQVARGLANKPFKAPDSKLPDNLKDLDYDHYRAIRFLPEHALWRGEKLPFDVQFFHRGFFYSNRVEIYEVANGQANKIAYQPEHFFFGDTPPPMPDADLGFAGFRLHAPINKPDYYDEVCVFLGASYFRAVAKGELYGLSARGLSINTGETKGEKFPSFRSFWIAKPASNPNSIFVPAPLHCTDPHH